MPWLASVNHTDKSLHNAFIYSRVYEQQKLSKFYEK